MKARSPRPNTRTRISRRSIARSRSSSLRWRMKRAPLIERGFGSSMSNRDTSSALMPKPSPSTSKRRNSQTTTSRRCAPGASRPSRRGFPARGRRRSGCAFSTSFFTRYRDAVAAAPEGHGMDYIHVHLVCRKALSMTRRASARDDIAAATGCGDAACTPRQRASDAVELPSCLVAPHAGRGLARRATFIRDRRARRRHGDLHGRNRGPRPAASSPSAMSSRPRSARIA